VQEGVLNEISLWMFINQEAFENTVPHHTVKEGSMWFLSSEDKRTAYIFLNEDNWKFGERKTFQIKAFKITKNSQITVLGHNGKVLEYQPEVNPSPIITPGDNGLQLSVTRAQRIYNDRDWNNPIVVKITKLDIDEKR